MMSLLGLNKNFKLWSGLWQDNTCNVECKKKEVQFFLFKFTDHLKSIPWATDTWKKIEQVSWRGALPEVTLWEGSHRNEYPEANVLLPPVSCQALHQPKPTRSQRCPWCGLYRLVSWAESRAGKGKWRGKQKSSRTQTWTSFLTGMFSSCRYTLWDLTLTSSFPWRAWNYNKGP